MRCKINGSPVITAMLVISPLVVVYAEVAPPLWRKGEWRHDEERRCSAHHDSIHLCLAQSLCLVVPISRRCLPVMGVPRHRCSLFLGRFRALAHSIRGLCTATPYALVLRGGLRVRMGNVGGWRKWARERQGSTSEQTRRRRVQPDEDVLEGSLRFPMNLMSGWRNCDDRRSVRCIAGASDKSALPLAPAHLRFRTQPARRASNLTAPSSHIHWWEL